MDSNPLLSRSDRIAFDRIQAQHVEPAFAQLLSQCRQALADLGQVPAPRTYANTLAVLDHLTDQLDEALSVVRHLESVATTPELRAAFNQVEPEVMAFYASLPLDEPLWNAVQAVHQNPGTLDSTQSRFLRKTYDGFRRHGAELSPEGKQKLQEIDVELAKLTTKYSENVLDATNAFEHVVTDEAALAGLPPSAIAAARQSAQSKGLEHGWRFTLQAPSYGAVLTYLDDRATREKFYRANVRRAAADPWDNAPLVEKILELRRAKAHLLGYFNFADLVLEERMARRGEMAREFLIELGQHTQDYFDREAQDLEAFANIGKLEPWDVAYYSEKLRKQRYDFDEEALRPYFPLDSVVNGMFDLCGKLFGFRVEPRPGVPVWDPAVRCYELFDASGLLLGSFYADWFPRENKRGGAWMDAFRTGGPLPGGGFAPHVGLICGNLTPPIGDQPALLTHREVETIFHEFGHLMHHCLARVPVRSLSGTSVAWDFVELPSQIMENWCWEKPALDLFAKHWQTGQPIPDDLFAKLQQARTFRAASAQMRQIGFGITDLSLHIDFDAQRYREETGGDVVQYAREVGEPYSPVPLPDDHAGILSFTHLFASPVGYGAGYYSYKWAEVLDADAFSRFKNEGVFNESTGRAFRECILEKGDSQDPGDLFRAFMGREPDHRALLARQGLLVLG